MRTGLTHDEELQVRRLRFDRLTERAYRIEAAETGRLRLRAVFAIGYLIIAAYNLQQIRAEQHVTTWDSLILRLGFPLLPLLASFSRLLTRYVMALTAFGWLVVVGSLMWVVPASSSDFLDKALIEVIVASCAVVLVRMPAYLVAFCGYALFAVFFWTVRRFELAQVTLQAGVTDELRHSFVALNRLSVELFGAVTVFVVGAYFTETIERRSYLTRMLLAEERRRTQNLITNMLPQPITERLLERPDVIADTHDAVTVLFADIVDFTPYAATHGAEEVVGRLNAIFSRFDEIVERAGIEKIKTIGDAYMVAAGLPEFRPDHLRITLDLSMEMMRVAHEMEMDLRVGIQSGKVVAGVIGTKKYLYDLWGDTVNIASRMESHGVPGKIQVTEHVAGLAGDEYAFEERGRIAVKGLGICRTYFLVGKARPPSPNDL